MPASFKNKLMGEFKKFSLIGVGVFIVKTMLALAIINTIQKRSSVAREIVEGL